MTELRGVVGSLTALALLIAGLVGCAPKQLVPLQVAPHGVTVFLDGKALDELPTELSLRSDRPHLLYFKREGFQPERVVLRTVASQPPRLEPERVEVALRPLEARATRNLEIEVDE
jgi:hypothetical protein